MLRPGGERPGSRLPRSTPCCPPEPAPSGLRRRSARAGRLVRRLRRLKVAVECSVPVDDSWPVSPPHWARQVPARTPRWSDVDRTQRRAGKLRISELRTIHFGLGLRGWSEAPALPATAPLSVIMPPAPEAVAVELQGGGGKRRGRSYPVGAGCPRCQRQPPGDFVRPRPPGGSPGTLRGRQPCPSTAPVRQACDHQAVHG